MAAARRLAVVVMAAGRGKRLRSALPKVLHLVCGKPVLWHVLDAASRLKPERLIVVLSHERVRIEEEAGTWGFDLTFVDQGDPLGTGHAVQVAEDAVGDVDDVLVLPGDNPLLTPAMLKDLVKLHRRVVPAATMQTTTLPDASGYGRVIRDGDRFRRIAESSDATAAERLVHEIATSVYAFRREDLYRALTKVGRDNVQHEYYLPDVLGILVEKGEDVRAIDADFGGALDVNSRGALARATAAMRRRINEDLMAGGVTLIDPERTYVDAGVKVGRDTTILPGVHLEGETRIGEGCEVGPDTRIVDSRVADGASITYSVVRGAKVGAGATVGPYASLRPGTVVGKGAKAGTFVEVKNSELKEGAKVPHLAYVGDATVGREANVGAGTITCNFDGYDKHRTEIGDGAFIGSDTMLVAPVRIGRGAVTGAGSTITKDVPDGALAVERAEQRNVEGYAERRRKARGKGRS